MIGGSGVTISCRNDGSQAVIDLLYPTNINGYPLTLDDVLTALRMNNVVNGIREFDIEDAIRKAVTTGEPQSGIIAAQCLTEKEIFFYGMTGSIGAHELSSCVLAARETNKALNHPEEEYHGASVLFVEKGDLLYQINMQDQENIFGKAIREMPLPVNLHRGENVTVRSGENCILFNANTTGYLVVDEESRLCVREPLYTSRDLLLQQFIVLPVRRDKTRAVMACYSDLHEQRTAKGLPTPLLRENLQDILDLQEKQTSALLPLCQGIAPVVGTNGELHYFINLEQRPEYAEEDRADYHEFSPFTFVSEGDKIAEYIHATNGVPGLDVYGRELVPPRGVELELTLGGNIRVESEENRDIIFAAISGTLNYNDKWVDVQESLFLSGDAGPDTGNIHFEKDVVISGDIKGGFLVESGQNVIVRGSIEAGAKVICNGNLTVFKGIFGRDSQILVKGNAEVGYIQEGYLQATGNITVFKYITDSWVKTRGTLTVQGQGVKGNERGAVMGGEVYSLGDMVLHSVGTMATPTRLGCGFDPDLYRQLKQCRTALAAMETNVLNLNRGLGIDLRSPQAAALLKRMTPEQRQGLAKKLEELRINLIRREELEKKKSDLEKLTFAPDLEAVSITINRHLVPRVVVTIGESMHVETSSLTALMIQKAKGGITAQSLTTQRKSPKPE